MDIDEQEILKKVRQIYMHETMLFEEHELDDDTYIGKMNGYKVASDELSYFVKGVQKGFDIPIVQADINDLSTLRDYSNLVIQKLKEK
ncbi:MAG: hypothetical protein GXO96_12025 [Nitrospirae bacterium]|nr:hypothetical protein [Candidatus Manganitrophaceae bacterium]